MKIVLCNKCGIETEKTNSQYNSNKTGLFFCSKECYYKYKTENKKDISQYLIDGKVISTHILKLKLIEFGIKEYKCEWEGGILPIELHHIDGNEANNKLENLQILCYNCHGLTDNFRGKKTKKDKIAEYFCNCGNKISKKNKKCIKCNAKSKRKIERPEYEELINLINNIGYSGVSKIYNVAPNTIKGWKIFYEK